MSFGKWQPFCLGLNELMWLQTMILAWFHHNVKWPFLLSETVISCHKMSGLGLIVEALTISMFKRELIGITCDVL